jgi:hypothetical protein
MKDKVHTRQNPQRLDKQNRCYANSRNSCRIEIEEFVSGIPDWLSFIVSDIEDVISNFPDEYLPFLKLRMNANLGKFNALHPAVFDNFLAMTKDGIITKINNIWKPITKRKDVCVSENIFLNWNKWHSICLWNNKNKKTKIVFSVFY